MSIVLELSCWLPLPCSETASCQILKKGPVGRALLCWSPVVQCRQRCDIFLLRTLLVRLLMAIKLQ